MRNCLQAYDRQSVVNAVASADLVVVCLGTGQDVEREGHDRSTLDLPGNQLDLLKDAVATGTIAPPMLTVLGHAIVYMTPLINARTVYMYMYDCVHVCSCSVLFRQVILLNSMFQLMASL